MAVTTSNPSLKTVVYKDTGPVYWPHIFLQEPADFTTEKHTLRATLSYATTRTLKPKA